MPSEADLVALVLARVNATGSATACTEVPLLGRSADLALLDGDALLTFEFKLANWRRAARQARDHRLVADYAYVCMPPRPVTDTMRAVLGEHGVGLAFCEADAPAAYRVILEAPRSNEVWPAARQAVLRYIAAGNPARAASPAGSEAFPEDA